MKNSSIIDKIAGNKTVRKVSIVAIVASILIIWISIAAVTYKSPEEKAAIEQKAIAADQSNRGVLAKVQAEIDKMDESTRVAFASTSANGYQGDIMKAELADGNGNVKVTVSTYFNKAGYENDGGQNIAKKLLGIMCIQIPELKSVYVVSESTMLESRSVHRGDIPGCKSNN